MEQFREFYYTGAEIINLRIYICENKYSSMFGEIYSAS